jgi:UPF0755 protein
VPGKEKMKDNNVNIVKKMTSSDLAAVICVSVCAVLLSIFVSVFIPVSMEKDRTKVVYVTYGTGLKKISGLLKTEGYIRNRFAFEAYAVLTNSNKKYQAGEYEFSPSQSAAEISRKLVKGDVKKHQVVVPEGSDLADIDGIFAESGMLKQGEILNAAGDPVFIKSTGIDKQTIEGFLFPDTYYIIRGETAEKILRTMYERFRQKAIIDMNRTYEIMGYKATGYKVLIMASIIEKESRLDAERFLVSSVFYNRLKSPEAYQRRLESCATVRYALNKKKGTITYKDIKVDSPYNTYVRIGLPVGPICNPGIKSMAAALKPAVTAYKYFVLYENGEHTFSETLEQHNRAKIANKLKRQEQE